jgi:hypothetical protein
VARPLETQTGEQAKEGDQQPAMPCDQIVSQATKPANEYHEFFGMGDKPQHTAKCFFKQAVEAVGYAPERVTTDGHDYQPLRKTLLENRIVLVQP